jgi:hypothetical protein
MQQTIKHIALFFIAATTLLTACEKNIAIDLPPGKPQLVVEAYINNLQPEYNYVILSKSQDYFAPNFQSTPVSGAGVSITEGEWQGNQVVWSTATKTILSESAATFIPPAFRSGVYFDARVFTNPSQSLLGKTGKYYLLEVLAEGRQYSAVTTLLPTVQIDSLTSGFPFVDDEGKNKLRVTNNYKDPDSIGNRQFYYWRFRDNRNNFGWGGLTKSRAPGTDDLANGQYIRLTHPQGFVAGDTLNYYMASVTADVWKFWDSYNKARDNDGPFSTPVNLTTNIIGTDVTGCFTGLSLSTKTIVMK